MIEKIVLDYLDEKLPVAVRMEVPPSPPDELVVIEKTGSRRENRVEHATLAIQSRAGSLYRAAEINELVKAAMDELAAEDSVFSVYLNSDYNFTDTQSKGYRYQAVYDICY